MQFKARYSGDLVLSAGEIRNRRPIRQGEVISFSGKTVERFGACIKALALQGKLAPSDDAARVFLDPRLMPVAAPAPAPEPDMRAAFTPKEEKEEVAFTPTESVAPADVDAPQARRKKHW